MIIPLPTHSMSYIRKAILFCSPHHYTEKIHKAVVDGNYKKVKKLLDAGVNPNTNSHNTILNDAIARNDLALVKLLLRYNANVNMVCPGCKNTPLWTALWVNNDSIAAHLLAHGANSAIPDLTNQIPLHRAVINGNEKMIQILLLDSYENAETIDDDHKKPIDYAKTPSIIELFKKQILFLKQIEQNPNTALLNSIIEEGYFDLIKLIIKKNIIATAEQLEKSKKKYYEQKGLLATLQLSYKHYDNSRFVEIIETESDTVKKIIQCKRIMSSCQKIAKNLLQYLRLTEGGFGSKSYGPITKGGIAFIAHRPMPNEIIQRIASFAIE